MKWVTAFNFIQSERRFRPVPRREGCLKLNALVHLYSVIKVIHEVVLMSPRSTFWFRRFFIMCTEDDKSSRISQFLIWKLSFSMSWKSQLIFHRCVDVMKWDNYSFLNVLSGVFVWEMLYVVFYDHMLWMNEVNKFTKKVLSLSLPSLFVRKYAGKPVFGRSDQVRQKPGCVAAEV